MRVAIDTNGIYITEAGVARYIRGLLRGLTKTGHPDLDVVEFAWKVPNLDFEQPRRALRTAYREGPWRVFVGPRWLAREQVELLHSTAGCFVRPPGRIPEVVTLHDLAVLRFPSRFRRWQRWSGRRRLDAIRSAARVICISRFTADEGIQLLGLDHRRIEVIHNGCDFHPDEPVAGDERPSFEVPAEYFLFVGSLEPGKNLSLLREGYRIAESRGIRLPPLLIVGARWPGVAAEGPAPRDWHYLGRQPDPVLVHLYRRALALLFPSRYEGFGLPVVEAMALGCPVVCSPVSSLAEVGAGAAHFVPLQPDAYCKAMQQLASNGGLRSELSQEGLRQARQFSWATCARRTIEVYRQALG